MEVLGSAVAGGVNTVRESKLLVRTLASVTVSRLMRLVDLTGPGLARLGATNELTAGGHGPGQSWSPALWSHPSRPDGLLYRARHDPPWRSVAPFSRGRRHVAASPRGD